MAKWVDTQGSPWCTSCVSALDALLQKRNEDNPDLDFTQNESDGHDTVPGEPDHLDLDLLGAICESFAWLLQDAYFSDISESRVVGPAPLMVNVRLTLDFCA